MTTECHGCSITQIVGTFHCSSWGVRAISPRTIKIGIAALVLVPAFVMASWLFTDTMVHATSDEKFCGSCHTMAPMVASYRNDVHGGGSERGVQAKCTQCHLPHDNSVNYMYRKARTGMHDVWAQLTYDLDAIDWQAKREHREDYVYDSGCIKCHSDLERASEHSAKSFVAHRPYFLGTTEATCVSCHERVGHKDLSTHLAATSKEGTPQ